MTTSITTPEHHYLVRQEASKKAYIHASAMQVEGKVSIASWKFHVSPYKFSSGWM